MSQQNIDFGTFPDDPAADAIRTAFNKVQNNFDQLFGANANATVTSINRTPGAGITVNYPTGNVVVSANIACVQVSTSSLSIGRGSNGSSSAVITSSTQTLVVDIDPAHVYSNNFADINNGLANFNGTLTVDSNAQPNITSLGNLTSLNVVGTANFTGSNLYVSNIANFRLMGGSAGNTIVTDGLGNLSWAAGGGGSGGAGGLDTQVQFNNNYALYGSASFTWDNLANVLTVSPGNIVTDDITANYFFGTLANGDSNIFVDANSDISFTANNVTTMVITKNGANIVGFANVTGNANVGNIGATQAIIDTSANIPIIQQGNSNVTITSNSNVTTYINGNTTARFTIHDSGIVANGTANISGAVTAGGNISTYGANGTVTANNITASGAATGNANVSTVTGSLGIRAIASTYTDNSAAASATIANSAIHAIAQPTLAAANSSVTFTNASTLYVANAPAAGTNATITNPYALYIANGSTYFGGANNFILGNLTVQGNATYYNVDSFNVEDPIISLGGGVNAAPLTTNDGKDRGTALQYYTTAPVTAFMGWDNGNGEFAFGSNVSITAEVVTYNSLGNARGLTWLGNVDGTYANFTGNITTTGNANLGNTATANYFVGRFYGTANAAIIANTVVDNAQPNITSVGTLTSLNVTGNTTSNNFIGSLANGNSNISILADSNINFNPIGNANLLVVTGTGINVAGTGNFTGNLSAGAHYGPLANGNSNVTIATSNGNITLTAVGNTTMTVTGTGANISGTANVSGNANVGNLGTATAIITTGNISTINSGLMQNGTSNLSIASGSNVTLAVASAAKIIATSAGANVVGTLDVSGNANTSNLGTGTLIATTGNITTINSGLMQNGNSNIAITSNANLTFTSKSNSTMVITDTGANITGTANVSGNANVGNLGAAQVLASANVTAPQLVSNVATGTAPLSVQSTTRVANLNVNYANVADYGVVTTQTTGTFYPVFVSANTTGNYAHASNANLSFNAATGNLSTTLLNVTSNANTGNLGTTTLIATTGNITTINSGLMKNATSNITITADSNITLTANAVSTLVISNIGANVTGNLTAGNVIGTIAAGSNTITTTGNANVGNLGFGSGVITGTGNVTAGNFIGNGASLSSLTGANVTGAVPYATTANSVAGANVTGAVSYATIANGVAGGNVSGNVASANVSYYANVATQTSGTYYPVFVSASTTSNYALASNTLISANLANGAVIATTFVGNILGNIGGVLANGNSNVSIPAANGNVNLVAVGNTTLVVTGTGANIAGTANVSGNANVGNLGAATAIITTGNITTINSGLMQNGNSNITITANANISHFVTGNATSQLTVTATGANIPGYANVVGNANVGNLGTAQVLASANVTSPQLISNIATGTAPLIVTSTTQVANLSVATAGSATTAGTVTTAAQPNITSVGTLSSLGVTGNTTSGNFLGVLANGNSNVNIPAANGNVNISAVGNANILVVTGTGANITGTANVSGNANVGNLGTAGLVVATGNVTGGNLTTGGIVSATGNITTGDNSNLISGRIRITSNAAGGYINQVDNSPLYLGANGFYPLTILAGVSNAASNVNVSSNLSVTGNANVGNLGTATAIITTGNITTINSGLMQNGTSNVTIASGGNVSTFIGGNATAQFVVTSTGANIPGTANVVGNANVGNLGTATAIITTGNITTINSGLMQNGNSNITITANANISHFVTGNATSQLTVTATGANIAGYANIVGNANVGNLGTATAIITTGNITTINSGLMQNGTSNVTIASGGNVSTFIGGNATAQFFVTPTGANITGTANVVGNANVGNLGATNGVFTDTVIADNHTTSGAATGNANVSTITGNLGIRAITSTYTDNSAAASATIANAAIHAIAQPTVSASNASVTFTNVATLYIEDAPKSLGNPTLTNPYALYVGNGGSFFGGSIKNYALQSSALATPATPSGTPTSIGGILAAGSYYLKIVAVDGLGGFSLPSAESAAIVTTGTTSSITASWTAVPGAVSYQLWVTTTSGVYTVYNTYTYSTTGATWTKTFSSLPITSGTLPTVNTSGTVTAPLLTISGNANTGNLGTTTLIATTGNITTVNSALMQNGNSNVSITANANVAIAVTGANRLVVTSTGANITGTANVSGNANVGNLGAAQVLASANVIAPQIISNIAIGTAPFVVTSTTVVANLNANALQGSAPASANTASTIALRDASGNLSANFFIGNGSQLTGISATTIANGNSNVSIPAANGNVNISAVGNTTLVITGTGANISGTANVSGNITAGNISATNHTGTTANITGQYITTLATGTAPFVVTSTTQVANLSVATAGTATSATTAGTVTTNAQPNITSVGTLTGLTVGNATANSVFGNGTIYVGTTSTISTGVVTIASNSATTNQLALADTRAYNANPLPDLEFAIQYNVAGAYRSAAYIRGGKENITDGNSASYLSFGTNGNTAGLASSERMRIDSSGNVGIANIAPTNTLSVTGTAYVSGNANTGNLGTTTLIATTGNITTINSGLMQLGTSNVTIASGANISHFVAGNATSQLTVTATGANIPGYANIVGNANVGNIGFGSGVVTGTGNITAGNVTVTSYHLRSVATAISAAGTTQGTATAITKEINVVPTVATGAGVILPTAVAGMVITITNTSANSLLVYPAVNGIINALAANAAFTHPTLATLQYIAPTTTQWYTVGATYS